MISDPRLANLVLVVLPWHYSPRRTSLQFIDDLFENTDITCRTDVNKIHDLSDLRKLKKDILSISHEHCRSRVAAQFSGMAATDSRGVGLISLFVTLSLVMITGAHAVKSTNALAHGAFAFLMIGAGANTLAALVAAWSIFPARIDYPGDEPNQWVDDDDFYTAEDAEKEAYLGMISNCQTQIFRNSEICRIKAYRQRFSISVSVLTLAGAFIIYLVT